jgi:transcriptional regulator with XRE-family HTH domain
LFGQPILSFSHDVEPFDYFKTKFVFSVTQFFKPSTHRFVASFRCFILLDFLFTSDKLGLSQKDFGKRINISDGHLSAIEREKDPPSDRIIQLICIEFGVNEEWLRYDIGEKSSYAIAAKKAWDDEVKGLKNFDNFVKQIFENNTRYLKLIALLAPSGALVGKIPLEYEPDLILMVNYLQYRFSQAKDEKEKLLITVKFESVFPDYIDVITKISADYKRIQKEMGDGLKEIIDYNKFFRSVNEVLEAGTKAEKEIEKNEQLIKTLEELTKTIRDSQK